MNYVSLIVGKRVHISQVYISFLSLSNYILYFTSYANISIHMERYFKGYIKEIDHNESLLMNLIMKKRYICHKKG